MIDTLNSACEATARLTAILDRHGNSRKTDTTRVASTMESANPVNWNWNHNTKRNLINYSVIPMQHWYFLKNFLDSFAVIVLFFGLKFVCLFTWQIYQPETQLFWIQNSKSVIPGFSIVVMEVSPLNVGNATTVLQWTYVRLNLTRLKLRFEGFLSWSLLKIQWVKTLSRRCQLIVTAAMKLFPLLQMEFLPDTSSYRVCSHDVTAAAMLEE